MIEGRLNEQSLNLLAGSDVQFHRHNRLDIALVKNLPIALVFLPAADIPTFVGEGRVDLGITGQDQVAEHEAGTPPTETTGVERVMDLGFGKCALQVQVPENGSIQEPSQLVGKNVVTSFENLTNSYFRSLEAKETSTSNGVNSPTELRTKITYVSGSVEAACALGVAHGVVDLVGMYLLTLCVNSVFIMAILTSIESGETMRAAGLTAIDTVLSSTAVLIKSKHPSNPSLVDLIASRIRGVITAQSYVMCTYNIQRSNLDAACKITPGKRAPTVTSLEEKDWIAVSAMVLRKEVATTMDRLSEIGAEDILVTKFENSRTA